MQLIFHNHSSLTSGQLSYPWYLCNQGTRLTLLSVTSVAIVHSCKCYKSKPISLQLYTVPYHSLSYKQAKKKGKVIFLTCPGLLVVTHATCHTSKQNYSVSQHTFEPL